MEGIYNFLSIDYEVTTSLGSMGKLRVIRTGGIGGKTLVRSRISDRIINQELIKLVDSEK